MRTIGIVFVGGGLGACMRAALLAWLAPGGSPWPVLLINLVGAFALGAVYVLADEAGLLHTRIRVFLGVGVLGGFTTFSTFGWGADELLAGHDYGTACAYLAASVGGGMIAVLGGLAAGRELVAVLERAAIGLLGRLDERGLRRHDGKSAMDAIEAEDREVPA